MMRNTPPHVGSGILTSKSPRVAMCFVPSYAPHTPCAPPLEKRLGNGPLPTWLKPPKMIASFTGKAMVKATPKTNIVCGRY